jgi:8-oxo-dGTP diphosphatase
MKGENHMSKIKTTDLMQGVTDFAVGVVVVNSGKILILRRVPADFLGGFYELPGGGVEKGEALEDAVKRETFEETGLQIIRVAAAYDGFDYEYKSKTIKQINFLVKTVGTNIVLAPNEHDGYVWVSKADLHKYPMTPEMRQTITNLFQKGVNEIDSSTGN